MRKQITSTGILCAIPLSALLLTLYCLETYNETVHNESSILVCIYSVIALIASTWIWHRTKRVNRGATAIWLLSVVMLMFVFYVGSKIPFCVVCDQVAAEDLGFLIHWIQPEGMAK